MRRHANQLSRWIRESAERRQRALVVASKRDIEAFTPVTMDVQLSTSAQPCLSLQARLPNGVVLDLHGCDLAQADHLIDALGRLRCSASTKD